MTERFEKFFKRNREEEERLREISRQIRQELVHVLEEISTRLSFEKAILFGSVREGRADPSSDVDLYITGLHPDQYYECMRLLEERLNRKVDLHTREEDPVFLERILEKGEVVYESKH